MGAKIGMLVVETIAKIRRAYFVHGQPIKAICRDLGVSRKVVRKVIRSEATEFRYEREAQPLPKIGPWSDKLDPRKRVSNSPSSARLRRQSVGDADVKRNGLTGLQECGGKNGRAQDARNFVVRPHMPGGRLLRYEIPRCG